MARSYLFMNWVPIIIGQNNIYHDKQNTVHGVVESDSKFYNVSDGIVVAVGVS